MKRKTTIYTIYTAEEKDTMNHLLGYLKSLKVDDSAVIWNDDAINFGQQWKSSDESRLEDTDIFLLLISNAFMYSEFIKQLEFKTVIDRHKSGKSKVIPIILDDCPWDIDFEADEYTFSFKELEVLPEEGKPVNSWDSIDQALTKSAVHIKNSITFLNANRRQEKIAWNNKIEDQLEISFSNEIKAKQKVAEEQRLQEVAEAKKIMEEEKRLEEETKAKSRTQEEDWFRERIEDKTETLMVEEEEVCEKEDVIQEDDTTSTRKKVLLAASLAVLALIGMFLFYPRDTENSEEMRSQPNEETVVAQDSNTDKSIANKKTKGSALSAAASLSNSRVGEKYQDGIIFQIDDTNKNGIVAHLDDAGPMIWKDAMKIHEKLGDGWRLPTLEELELMHKTIGPGATNSGEFTDELYWSATPFDKNQARLVRFEDGNTTFHYNSIGAFRKFLVRAVRDF